MLGGGPAGTMPAMLITRHQDFAPELAPGWRADCLAGAQQGGGQFEVWRFVLAVGGASPWITGAEHQVVLVLAGNGKVRLASGPLRFSAPCTLAIPPQTEHQFVNLGALELQLVVVRGNAADLQVQAAPSGSAAAVVTSG